MKRLYIKPSIEVTLVDVEGLLQTISKPLGGTTVPGDFSTETPDVSESGSETGEGMNDAKHGWFNWDDDL